MTYDFAMEAHDIKRIEKLNNLTNSETFYKDVIKFTKNIHSDHGIRQWERLSEIRNAELELGKEFNDTYFYNYYRNLIEENFWFKNFTREEYYEKFTAFQKQFSADWDKHLEIAENEKRQAHLHHLEKLIAEMKGA